ncbi:trna-dihydrouridine synthase [Tubulinosema ratisbonensis]|uniref:tRNA-dihydrouridine synthase n=1 Tax=Tubulinosema ratisbonensis TaxID=291195 RepID=A0A437AM61_9MICR|nr:trna-dihydrouridine synthase [Tubulinosema ratisbonensis]
MKILELIKKKKVKILAPMVNYSDLAYRILARKYGADICYTEMVNTEVFLRNKCNPEKNQFFYYAEEDRPLVIQICGNKPQRMLEVALILQSYCDAIDINFGYPQNIAKRGNYGAFLENDWGLIKEIVKLLSSKLRVPLFCKIRIFEDKEKTLKYAKLFEENGCKLLVVHGRTKEQRGVNTGMADWNVIKEIKSVLNIPVISNGNILYHSDIQKCLDYTNCDGVMVAETHIYDPSIFTNQKIECFTIFKEYISLLKKYQNDMSLFRNHFFKMFHKILEKLPHFREEIHKVKCLEEGEIFVDKIENEFKSIFEELDDLFLQPRIRGEIIEITLE